MTERARLLSVAFMGALLMLPLGLVAQDADPKKPAAPQPTMPYAGKLTDNIKARLVATRTSQRRGQNLEAKFVTLGEKPEEISIRFPSHSFRTHEVTLMTVIRSCGRSGGSLYEWQDVSARATFSMPRDAEGYVTDYSKWFLVSLELPKGK